MQTTGLMYSKSGDFEQQGKNFILGSAEKLGLIEFNPVNRGADMIGKGLLNGTWWDVTTPGSWAAHVAKYGSGGIPLFH